MVHTVQVEREEEILSLMALQSIARIGAVSLKNLLAAASLPQLLAGDIDPQLLAFLPSQARSGLTAFLRNPMSSPQRQQAEAQLQQLKALGAWVISGADPQYPPLLSASDDAPLLLYGFGDISCLSKVCISIVGTRKPTAFNRRFTERLASDLASAGVTVVSGMAIGADTHAHRGALQAVGGSTAAVWAAGLDRCYPAVNQQLALQIAAQGCVLTEMPLATAIKPGLFPRRNRIVSGLSHAVVVTEAALKSGSMITARLALEQNRDVFAVPGVVGRETSAGCHWLIKQGAGLVENAQDVIDGLSCFSQLSNLSPVSKPTEESATSVNSSESKIAALPATLRQIIESVDDVPTPLEVLHIRTEMPIAELSAALIDLELLDLIAVDNGLYSRLC